MHLRAGFNHLFSKGRFSLGKFFDLHVVLRRHRLRRFQLHVLLELDVIAIMLESCSTMFILLPIPVLNAGHVVVTFLGHVGGPF